jgi:hypothetical protein
MDRIDANPPTRELRAEPGMADCRISGERIGATCRTRNSCCADMPANLVDAMQAAGPHRASTIRDGSGDEPSPRGSSRPRPDPAHRGKAGFKLEVNMTLGRKPKGFMFDLDGHV